VTYSQSRAQYSYAYGGGALPYEEDGTEHPNPRGTFTIHGLDGEEGVTYYGAARTGQDHGTHFAPGSVELEAPRSSSKSFMTA